MLNNENKKEALSQLSVRYKPGESRRLLLISCGGHLIIQSSRCVVFTAWRPLVCCGSAVFILKSWMIKTPGHILFVLQKDSHTLYLEQELESLKVVLDIKNEQLHQQEKKLMEVEKLVRDRENPRLLSWEGMLYIQESYSFILLPEREKCEAGRGPEEGPAGEWGPESSHGSTHCTVEVRADRMSS